MTQDLTFFAHSPKNCVLGSSFPGQPAQRNFPVRTALILTMLAKAFAGLHAPGNPPRLKL